MEKIHRRSIQANVEGLTNIENIDELVTQLVNKGVFREFMVYDLKTSIQSPRDFRLQLFLDVQKRGPEAFQSLLDSLKHIGRRDLAELLANYAEDEDGNAHTTRSCDEVDSTANPVGSRFQKLRKPVPEIDDGSSNEENHHPHPGVSNGVSKVKTKNCQESSRKAVVISNESPNATSDSVVPATSAYNGKDAKNCYRMLSNPRGRALVINVIKFKEAKRERRGASHDTTNLRKLFADLNFEVDFTVGEVDKDDLYANLERFIEKCSEKEIDCCMVVVMSHGEGKYKIETSDGLYTDFYKLISKKFSNLNFKKFCRKPKIFVMQACRGKEENYVLESSQSQTESQSQSPERDVSYKRLKSDGSEEQTRKALKGLQDTIIINSTIPGFKSMRDENKGTIFIESVCDILRQHAFELNLDEMIHLINEDMKTKSDYDEYGREILQAVHLEKFSAFLNIYFNPGL